MEILNRYKKGASRSKAAAKNIFISLISKGILIVSSLLIIPLTIDYINPTQYGIWLTLSSVIGWISFFDLGLGNGFRNKFAEAKAKGDVLLARQYLSTTYFSIFVIVLLVFVIMCFGNQYVDWASFLKVENSYNEELSRIFVILSAFFCMNMIAGVFGTMLTADQKPGYTSMIQGLGQFISLMVIFILTKTTDGSLTNLALYFAGTPCFVMTISSIIMYLTHYKSIAPRLADIRYSLIKDILNMGVNFFVIYLCLIMIFQIMNVVISREVGPLGVTQYNIADRYFKIVYMIINIIITPFWSAFTDAYVKKDFAWMKSVIDRLEKIWLLSVCVGTIMVALSPIVYRLWIGNSVDVPFRLSLSVFILIECQSFGAIYMYPINGIGKVRLQTLTYVFFAVICWPSLVYACNHVDFAWVFLIPAAVYFAQGILGKIQLYKLFNNTAKGIWNK